MRSILPVLLKDFYKVGHKFQYPENTTLVFSNLTPRSSRVLGVNEVVPFGFQYFVQEYLINQFEENFFDVPRDVVLKQYKRRVDNALGPGTKVDHIGELHELGHLPLHIKAIPEGTLLPLRVPALTLWNTDPKFFWLTNMVETLLSNVLWLPSTSATTAFQYRRVFERYAKETGADLSFVPWQGHDFSFRGMAGIEAACLSGAAHLLSFTGTDTIPAIDFLEQYYGANSDRELIGGSVPATEHSVMCMGLRQGELDTIRRLFKVVYPSGIVSIVSDTWDFWTVITKYLPKLKEDILAREGKVVIRPDSGDPVKIICGDPEATKGSPENKGAIECLWEIFGGTVTSKGHRVLDPHIGLIYGDSITPERQVQILDRLSAKKFASSNVVLGIGSYTYQHVTRDTFGWAMKATYGEVRVSTGPGESFILGQNIFKEPKTDDGTKNSAKGLLTVEKYANAQYALKLEQEVSWARVNDPANELKSIFNDGRTMNIQKLSQIRERLASYL
jgi:nicotinamide phosphoribosyltransferase